MKPAFAPQGHQRRDDYEGIDLRAGWISAVRRRGLRPEPERRRGVTSTAVDRERRPVNPDGAITRASSGRAPSASASAPASGS